MPESLVRAQKLGGKKLLFYQADLCDKDSLRAIFAKVNTMHSRAARWLDLVPF